MSGMHLEQPGFTYSVCGLFTKSKEGKQKFKETGDSRYIYQNELDEKCFPQDMAYGDSKIYLEEQHLIKYYVIKELMLLVIQNIMGISVDLSQRFIDFLIKNLQLKHKQESFNAVFENQQLISELDKLIIKIF